MHTPNFKCWWWCTVSLELDCFDLVIGPPVILQEVPSHLCSHAGFFPTRNIIDGTLQAKCLGGNKWKIIEYLNMVKTYKAVMKITLKETHKSIYELVSLFKAKITKNYRK